MPFVSCTCEHFTELHYNIVEGILIFSIVSIFINIILPPLNKSVGFRPVQVPLLLKLLAHGVLQRLLIPIMVSLQAAQDCPSKC
jgi:hypothetical protein